MDLGEQGGDKNNVAGYWRKKADIHWGGLRSAALGNLWARVFDKVFHLVPGTKSINQSINLNQFIFQEYRTYTYRLLQHHMKYVR